MEVIYMQESSFISPDLLNIGVQYEAWNIGEQNYLFFEVLNCAPEGAQQFSSGKGHFYEQFVL